MKRKSFSSSTSFCCHHRMGYPQNLFLRYNFSRRSTINCLLHGPSSGIIYTLTGLGQDHTCTLRLTGAMLSQTSQTALSIVKDADDLDLISPHFLGEPQRIHSGLSTSARSWGTVYSHTSIPMELSARALRYHRFPTIFERCTQEVI